MDKLTAFGRFFVGGVSGLGTWQTVDDDDRERYDADGMPYVRPRHRTMQDYTPDPLELIERGEWPGMYEDEDRPQKRSY